MYFNFCVFLLIFVCSFTDGFFLFGEKTEPVFFCIKVCPLYCSSRKRRDVDASNIYWDESPIFSHDHIIEDFPPHFYSPYFFCKPTKKPTTTTTTTMATTTEEPTWICMVCMKKCNFPKKA